MPEVREHRGGLAESLQTVHTVESRYDLYLGIKENLARFGFDVAGQEKVKVEPYGYDSRIGWDTYIITVEGYGVWGFSKGDISDINAANQKATHGDDEA